MDGFPTGIGLGLGYQGRGTSGQNPLAGRIRVTDNGNTRVTSTGDVRITAQAPNNPRVTDDGNTRTTSAGSTRVVVR